MSNKKVIHELSVEDLIRLAQDSDQPVVMDGLSEASKFIYALNIRHGDVKIPAQVIYYTYKQWKGWDKKPQPKPYFFRDFTKYFEKQRTSEGIVYLLDPKPFDLSTETYFMIRKDIRESKAKKSKKGSTGSN